MGYHMHHVLIVTTWCDKSYLAVVEFAKKNDIPIVEQPSAAINGYRSLVVFPDGSKEGWPDSDAGDNRRALLGSFLRRKTNRTYVGFYVDWVEVAFGGDFGNADIIDGSHIDTEEDKP